MGKKLFTLSLTIFPQFALPIPQNQFPEGNLVLLTLIPRLHFKMAETNNRINGIEMIYRMTNIHEKIVRKRKRTKML